ncbi:unnamed protein product [Euphydryas editha]|nr:unnamed protein product [Euphydryas editha]
MDIFKAVVDNNLKLSNEEKLCYLHKYLADLQPIQKGTAANIRNFLAQIQQHIYALKDLEQPVHNWDMLLFSILSRKLDTYTNMAYHLDKENPLELPTLNEFISFLEKRAMTLEDSPAERKEW